MGITPANVVYTISADLQQNVDDFSLVQITAGG